MIPYKPYLEIVEYGDGGFCLSRDDATRLGQYILGLEYALGIDYGQQDAAQTPH